MTTYMELTNRLLRRVNDVEITESDFLSVRGVQATAKDCILDTVREINSSKIDWTFNAVEHCQTLDIGVEEYSWPAQFTSADWDSFQIEADEDLGVQHRTLQDIAREQWYKNSRDRDYDSSFDGRGIPSFVFPAHGQGWGVSPSPDQPYHITYRYYKNPTDLVAYNDDVTIPSRFDYVIMAGALYHMNLFKENPDGAQLAKQKYDSGIRDMVNVFLPNPSRIYDTRVNFGGGSSGAYGQMWDGY